MILNFIKEDSGAWFIDLPEYLEQGGSKGDLAMVAGADKLLDEISNNSNKASIEITDRPDQSDLSLLRSYTLGWGYYYDVIDIRPDSTVKTKKIWLCPVTKFVFGGKYPKYIHVILSN